MEPLLHMGVFYLVFGVLMRTRTENFILFLLTGLIPWLWFSKSVGNATASIFAGRHIMMQTPVPIALFPAEIVLQDSVKQLLVFSLLFLFVALVGSEVTIHWLALLPLIFTQLTLIMAVAFVTAMIVPFIPDMRYLVNTGLTLMMFGSGVFYSDKLISPEYREYFYLNPMANMIRNYREVLIEHHWPDWSDVTVIFLLSLMVLLGCLYILDRTRTTYVRLAIQSK